MPIRRPDAPRSRFGRAVRLAARASAAVLALLAVYIALVQLDVLRSPFDPRVRGDVALLRSRDAQRVLFVGNSLTYYNDMPVLVQRLAASAVDRKRIAALAYAAPAWSLEEAARDDGLERLLREFAWDVVVLQEQSQLPSLDAAAREGEFERPAFELDARIDAAGAETVLFMTWGYREGDDDRRDDTYAAMQARLARGYWDLAEDLHADVAPVGLAWAEALRRDPDLALWQRDGRHPTAAGSYLAACVFYALLGGEPEKSRFTAGLPPADARALQRVAADVVDESAAFEQPR